MFRERDIQHLDKSYFNIVLTGDFDVTVQSKNTGHFWYIHYRECHGEGDCVIFHKHRASHPYHQHGKAKNLRQAVRKIKGHDVFQMNGRR
ncbi:hypothetical protein [Lactonifactor longoviformis]|uniref:hypothetical protein n=1 Tax=Lactonifactor longoviformis TaxID=341220 RepID=UPI0036F3B01E